MILYTQCFSFNLKHECKHKRNYKISQRYTSASLLFLIFVSTDMYDEDKKCSECSKSGFYPCQRSVYLSESDAFDFHIPYMCNIA